MKRTLLLLFLSVLSFSSFASNKVCVGETVVVVFNEELKKLTVHEKESLEIRQSTSLEGFVFGEIALSKDESKIWFQMDGIMYARDTQTGEIVKEIQGSNVYTFELSAAMDYLIHFEMMEQDALVYVYDLNTAEAISYAKLPFADFLETIHFDAEEQQLHLLSKPFASKTEKPSKEPVFGVPETLEEVALDFRHDGMESRYVVYDIANKKELYNEVIEYSPDYECNFEVIDNRLFIITALGSAEVQEDFSLKLEPLFAMNMTDYAIFGTDVIGVTGFDLFSYSVETQMGKEWDEDKVNLLLIKASGLAVTETDYYFIAEGVLYRVKRAKPLNIDFETSLE